MVSAKLPMGKWTFSDWELITDITKHSVVTETDIKPQRKNLLISSNPITLKENIKLNVI